MSDLNPNPDSTEAEFDPHRFSVEPKKRADKKIIKIITTFGFLGLVIAGSLWFGKWQINSFFDNMNEARDAKSEAKKADTQPAVSRNNNVVFPKLENSASVVPIAPATSEKAATSSSEQLSNPNNNAGAIPVIPSESNKQSGSVPLISSNQPNVGPNKEVIVVPMMLPSVAAPKVNLVPNEISSVPTVTTPQRSLPTLDVKAIDLFPSNEPKKEQLKEVALPTERPRTVEALAAIAAAGSAISATAQSTSANVGDRSRVILRGSYIECVLESQLVSNIPGITACIVPVNIYSDNGKRLLIRKGSKLVGEYSATVKPSDTRFGVMWQRIKTPDGVVIDVDSGAADSVGAMGLSGAFDSHWAQRLGGAFMFSIIADGISTQITPRITAGPDGTQIAQPSATVETAQTIAKSQVDSSLNISSTFFKSRGDRVSVFVNRDLWFE